MAKREVILKNKEVFDAWLGGADIGYLDSNGNLKKLVTTFPTNKIEWEDERVEYTVINWAEKALLDTETVYIIGANTRGDSGYPVGVFSGGIHILKAYDRTSGTPYVCEGGHSFKYAKRIYVAPEDLPSVIDVLVKVGKLLDDQYHENTQLDVQGEQTCLEADKQEKLRNACNLISMLLQTFKKGENQNEAHVTGQTSNKLN